MKKIKITSAKWEEILYVIQMFQKGLIPESEALKVISGLIEIE